MKELLLIISISYWICFVIFWIGLATAPFYWIKLHKEGVGRLKDFKDKHGSDPLSSSIVCIFFCIALHFAKIAVLKWGM